ncbi:MAG: VTT domain-containing protein [Chloroflexi bacterium]|nr:VTT domain-containing protein [Chloroflexota bacterium]
MESSKVKKSKVEKLAGSKVKRHLKKDQPANLQPENLPTLKPATNLGTNILRIFVITAVIGITVYIYSVRERVDDFAEYGYPGIFLIALMANATVLLPAPGVAVVFAMGSILNPIGVALAAGIGGAMGELSGYLAGFSGQAVVERTEVYNKINPWIEKYGGWTILVLSAIPNPFFDIAGIAAGIAKMKLWRFLLFCWVGQIIKMAMFAFAGAYSIDWIASFYK